METWCVVATRVVLKDLTVDARPGRLRGSPTQATLASTPSSGCCGRSTCLREARVAGRCERYESTRGRLCGRRRGPGSSRVTIGSRLAGQRARDSRENPCIVDTFSLPAPPPQAFGPPARPHNRAPAGPAPTKPRWAARPDKVDTLPELRIFIPANAGGGWDQTGRALGAALQATRLVDKVQYENVGGKAGTLGLAQFVEKYPAAPNTLMVGGMVMLGGIALQRPAVEICRASHRWPSSPATTWSSRCRPPRPCAR